MDQQENIHIIVAGDFCPKDRTANLLTTPNRDELLKDIIPIVKSCDLAIVNLECPLVFNDARPITKSGPNLKTIPLVAQILKDSGFSLATLANNHILDYGEVGLQNTIDALKRVDLPYVGVGENLQKAKKIFYFERCDKKIAIINCCEHEFSIASETSAGANPLNPVQQWYEISEARQKADYVIVIIHGGHEHYSLPSPRMQETYRFFIDSGADAVVNHHQHCYSGYEIYNGKPIFYGLGNLCFDWNGKRNSKWNYGYLVELQLGTELSFILHPYEQCNNTPKVSLLTGENKKKIEDDVNQLNEIILCPERIREHHNKWMLEGERNWLISLTPITNRYINALVQRKIFPVWIPKKKIIALLNKVACESHRDKLIYILQNNI